MVVALTPGEVREYVPKSDRDLTDEEGRTTFKLRTLTAGQYAKLENSYLAQKRGGDDVQFKAGDYALAALKEGLVGCRNLKDAKGDEIPWETDRVGSATDGPKNKPTNDFLSRLPQMIRIELADAIVENSRLSEADASD